VTLPVNEPARAQHTPRPSARTLWKGALILSQDPAVGELRGDVLVDGATITEVSAHVEADDGTVVDASRFALLPGGLGHAVGSITPGKQADFVLVDLTHVNLVAAPDPVGVIVASGHAGNIDIVVLAGRVVKRRGALLDDDLVSRVSRLAIASRERLEREVAGRG